MYYGGVDKAAGEKGAERGNKKGKKGKKGNNKMHDYTRTDQDQKTR